MPSVSEPTGTSDAVGSTFAARDFPASIRARTTARSGAVKASSLTILRLAGLAQRFLALAEPARLAVSFVNFVDKAHLYLVHVSLTLGEVVAVTPSITVRGLLKFR